MSASEESEIRGAEFRARTRRLGWPQLEDDAEEPGVLRVRPRSRPEAVPERQLLDAETAVVSICTRDWIHQARALFRSVRRHMPGAARLLVVADWDGRSPFQLPEAIAIPAREVCPRLGVLALKLDPLELCCALKPYALRWVARQAVHRHLVYLDADVVLFDSPSHLVDELDDHEFVVLPHTLEPPRGSHRGQRPTIQHLGAAGPLNAGIFSLRNGPVAEGFLSDWIEMVSSEDAFLEQPTSLDEQRSFNWVLGFVDAVKILRDRSYNVAYWNLHERSLRCRCLDDSDDSHAWTVDGRPLVAYHFSGFSLRSPHLLSSHDSRHLLLHEPSLACLVRAYSEELYECGATEAEEAGYGFALWPSGIEVDPRMRSAFKRHGVDLWSEFDPWSPEGERTYARALLRPVAGAGSLLPALLARVYEERIDLQHAYPRAHVAPGPLLGWFLEHGARETDCSRLIDRHRPTLPKLEALDQIEALRRENPGLFRRLEDPLGSGRSRLLGRLEAAGLVEWAKRLRKGEFEYYDLSTLWLIRCLVADRNLRSTFPDLLAGDAGAFAAWLERFGVDQHGLPSGASRRFRWAAEGRSLARIFSYLTRRWDLMERFPLGLVGDGTDELARHLLARLREGPEYSIDDVVMLLWVSEEDPGLGVPLTLELPIHRSSSPSPLLPEGQERILASVLDRPGIREALIDHRRRHAGDRLAERSARRSEGSPAVVSDRPHAFGADGDLAGSLRPGVNLFGYFRSPIGLGTLSRGLRTALGRTGRPVQSNLATNVVMSRELAPRDFVRTFRHDFDTSVFVSYPHLPNRLLAALPEHACRGRRNIAYLAWEQRDFTAHWKRAYEDFDQIWALSSFAARALSRGTGRPVETVPPVVDFGRFPPPAAKVELGLRADRFHFLYMFDANSSLERKNPEAVLEAFRLAFEPGDPVELILKVSNPHGSTHREALECLQRRAADSGLDVLFLLGNLSRRESLRLISACDGYVSLHRSEGFGYTCAEAMAYARPVILTGYSGVLDFAGDDTALLVDFEEREVRVAEGPFPRGSVWAEPDVEHAATLMRRLFEGSSGVRELGQRARERVRAKFSPEAVAVRVEQLLSAGGESAAGAVRRSNARDGRVRNRERVAVSLVVPVWNGRRTLAECLEALLAQTWPGVEVIAVDDASDDDSASLIRDGFPEVRLFCHATNRGFGAACNEGARIAEGELLVLVNQDAVLSPSWVERVVEFLEGNRDAGIVGGKGLFPDGTVQHAGGWLDERGNGFHFGAGEPDDGRFDRPRQCEYLTGAALAIRRTAWERTGGFDEGFRPAYYEDVDWCLRASKSGWEVFYLPEARFEHRQESGAMNGSLDSACRFHRNRLRLVLKHFEEDRLRRSFLPAEIGWLRSLGNDGDHAFLGAVGAAYRELRGTTAELTGLRHSLNPGLHSGLHSGLHPARDPRVVEEILDELLGATPGPLPG